MLIAGLRRERDELYRRIDERAAWMFANGLLDEARTLLHYAPGLPAMSAIGYPEARAVVLGELSLDEAIERTRYANHRYARHQQTWYRRFPDVHWFDAGDDGLVVAVSSAIRDLVRSPEQTG
jgi:tRNA dimethylallyltransferase